MKSPYYAFSEASFTGCVLESGFEIRWRRWVLSSKAKLTLYVDSFCLFVVPADSMTEEKVASPSSSENRKQTSE